MKFFPIEFKIRKHAIMFLTESWAAAMHHGLLFLLETYKKQLLPLSLCLSHNVCDRTPPSGVTAEILTQRRENTQ